MPTEITPKIPATPTDKPEGRELENKVDRKDGKNFDRFHPDMPTIPGVLNTDGRSATGPRVNSGGVDASRLARIGGIVAAIVLALVGIAVWIRHSSRASIESVSDESVAQQSSATDTPPLPSAAQSSELPMTAATVEELSKPWSSKNFSFVKPMSTETVNAIVVRLPGGALWAFSLRDPGGRCDLEFLTDLGEIERKYGYHASHPMAANTCEGTVYDPLKVGPLGGSTWARGEIVKGVGLRPPISIDVQVHGQSIIADAIE